jgi:hypothetical protein
MLNELGSFTAAPFRKTDRPVPSEFAHSNFGDSRFQSDQNTFLHHLNKQSKLIPEYTEQYRRNWEQHTDMI